jgi:hypothetical protein
MFSGNLGSDIPIELIQELEKRDPGANVLEFLKVSKAGNLEGITLKAVELTRDFVKANSAKILGLLGWSLEEEAVLARAAEATAMAFVMSTLAYSVTPEHLNPAKELRQYGDALKGYVRACGNTGQEYDNALDSAISMIRNLSAIATDAIKYQWTLDGNLILAVLADHVQEFEELGLTDLIHELGELGKRELSRPVMADGYFIDELPEGTEFAPSIFVSKN